VFHASEKRNETYWPESGGKNIVRYGFASDFNNFVSYGEWCYNKPAWEFCSEPRILIREILGDATLVCAATSAVHVPTKAVIIVLPRTIGLSFLLGILNSRLIGFYVQHASEKGRQRLFPRVSLTTIRQLPIRTIDFSDADQTAGHDRVGELVQQMLELHEQLSAGSTAHDRQLLRRQIDSTDRQIDQLVYSLYGLTDEEIEVVERSGTF
jgi:hypothetical protein